MEGHLVSSDSHSSFQHILIWERFDIESLLIGSLGIGKVLESARKNETHGNFVFFSDV